MQKQDIYYIQFYEQNLFVLLMSFILAKIMSDAILSDFYFKTNCKLSRGESTTLMSLPYPQRYQYAVIYASTNFI